MEKEYTYAVSRVHAKEMDMLSAADIEQVLSCENFHAAALILSEKGYGNGEVYKDFESLRKDELNKMWDFIHEVITDTEPFKILFRQTDFHNLKAAVKMVLTAENSSDYFINGGTISPELILNCVKQKNFGDLPSFMAEVARKATESLAKYSDGQECDIYIDKSCLETMIVDGENSDIDIIREYTELYVAMADIKIAVRCCLTNKSKGFMMRALARCNSLDIDSVAMNASKGIDALYEYLEHTKYSMAVHELKISMSEFEKWVDNEIMNLIKLQKSNPFTAAPIFAYILAKENELKALQIVLTGIKNDLDTELIRERIRDLYV